MVQLAFGNLLVGEEIMFIVNLYNSVGALIGTHEAGNREVLAQVLIDLSGIVCDGDMIEIHEEK